MGVGPLADTCGDQERCSRLGGPRCPSSLLTRWWALPEGDVDRETRSAGGALPVDASGAALTVVAGRKERLIRVIALVTARAAAISTEGRAVVLAVTVCSAWAGSAISVTGCTAGWWMGARRALRQLGAAGARRAVLGACAAGAGRSARDWPYTRR